MTSFRREDRIPLHELTREAQVFLAKTRVGEDFERACELAKVAPLDVRAWLRDPDFAEHYQRAKRREGPQCIALGAPSTWPDSPPLDHLPAGEKGVSRLGAWVAIGSSGG